MIRTIIWICTVVLSITFYSCDREEFDIIESHTEAHSPNLHLLQTGNFALNIYGEDTLSTIIDSVYCEQLTMDTINFIGYDSPTVVYKWKIMTDHNPDLLETEKYDLVALQRLELVYDQTGTDTILNNFFVLNPGNQMVEITESEQHYNSVYGTYSNQISGFIDGALVDDNNEPYQITSFFNRIERFTP